jgi:hypothetical protein
VSPHLQRDSSALAAFLFFPFQTQLITRTTVPQKCERGGVLMHFPRHAFKLRMLPQMKMPTPTATTPPCPTCRATDCAIAREEQENYVTRRFYECRRCLARFTTTERQETIIKRSPIFASVQGANKGSGPDCPTFPELCKLAQSVTMIQGKHVPQLFVFRGRNLALVALPSDEKQINTQLIKKLMFDAVRAKASRICFITTIFEPEQGNHLMVCDFKPEQTEVRIFNYNKKDMEFRQLEGDTSDFCQLNPWKGNNWKVQHDV